MTAKKTVKAPAKKPAAKKEVKHITPTLIFDVLDGDYGEGAVRNAKLKELGYSPSAVTKKINDLKKLMPEAAAVLAKAGPYWGCLCLLLTEEQK